MVRVAINGFGRIGRMILRAGINTRGVDFVAINDLTDTKTLAHLFKHDSVYGKFPKDVGYDEKNLVINKKKIPVFSEREPEKLPWKDMKVDVVVESTGFFTTKELASKHLTAGAKKVLISAPAKGGGVKTIVFGVNENTYDKKTDHVISNASCTTNCLAPVAKVLNDKIGIVHGIMTTDHAYTSTQKLVDGPDKDLRRARAAAINIIPTHTGAADAITEVIPELKGKLTGVSIRVPVITVSLVDLTVEAKKKTSVEEVNQIFKQAAGKEMKGIIEYSEEPLVSTDIIGNTHSAIFDSELTQVIDGSMVKIFAWYDNEWGYSCRMVDVLSMMV